MNVNEKIALKETAIDVTKTVVGGVLGAGSVLVSIRTAQVVGLTAEQAFAGVLIIGTFVFMGLGILSMYKSKVSYLDHLDRLRQIEEEGKAEREQRRREMQDIMNRNIKG